jgi:hypothetical protein
MEGIIVIVLLLVVRWCGLCSLRIGVALAAHNASVSSESHIPMP